MAEYNCPNCQTEETQSVIAIVDAETYHGTGSFFGRGRVRHNDGDYADAQVSGSTSEISRSQLAITLGPPDKKKWFLKTLIVAGLVYLNLDYFFYASNILNIYRWDFFESYKIIRNMIEDAIRYKDYLLIATLIGCAILLPLAIRNFLYNVFVYDKDYADWSNQWYCHRCGSIFVP